MNYYPFHVGDYAAHTAHLEPMEDLAYRRMLDLYYRTEKPLPSSVEDIARLVRLRDNGAVIRDVLNEFFIPCQDGWRHARCDEEIERMQDKQATQEAKAAHETERMRRHRERRAELFEKLRDVGMVPAWDTPIKELQRLSELPATHLQREQAVSTTTPATAIPTPTPTPTPTISTEANASVSVAAKTQRPSRKAPASFALTAGLREWAAEHAPGVDAETETAKFLDHTFTAPKSDWLGTWRNWMRKANETRAVRRVGHGPPAEPEWVTERKERARQFLGPSAAKPIRKAEVIDMGEIFDAKQLG